MKKLLSIIVVLIITTALWAADFTVDDIAYNVIDAQKRNVEVTKKDPKYSGSVTIPSSVTYNSMTFTVTSIGKWAFGGCSSISSITIPNSVTSIGDYAFWWCDSLSSITIGNNVTIIGSQAFWYCTSLTSIIIPNSVVTIGKEAFASCTSLTSINIPNSVTSIGNSAFYNCDSLTSITVVAANTHYASEDGVLFNYAKDTLIQYPIGNKRTEYTIPNSVTSIGYEAFDGCPSVANITIPNSVTSIGDWVFYKCSSLSSITIGNSVTNIGRAAFDGCTAIDTISVECVTPPLLGEDAFNNVSHFIPLFVPEGSKTDYQAADGWKDFLDIREMATFPYTLIVQSVDLNQGSAEVLITPTSKRSAVISATANIGYAFSHWSDGNTDNPRTITVTKDTTLIAYFSRTFVIVDVQSANPTLGYVIGGGKMNSDTTISITAACSVEGYHFSHWSDGSTVPGRQFYVTSDTTLIAYFVAEEPAECVEVSVNNPTLGTADIQIIATPVKGCTFSCWLDGNTDNPRTVTDSPGSYMAIFTGIPSAIERTSASNPQNPKFIIDDQLIIQRDGKTYNAQGGEL